MQDAIRKAGALIEALPYIRSFQGKVIVIKFGGAAMEDGTILDNVLQDVAFLEAVGIRPILVHGGGPAISQTMKERHIEPRFVHGHRVTDEATLAIVREILGDRINADICRRLNRVQGHAAPFADPLAGALRARRRVVREKTEDGRDVEVDIGLVGDMESVDEPLFRGVLARGEVPVVAPLALGPDKQVLNVNGDMVAACVAAGLRVEKAVFLSNTHGILTDPSNPASFAGTLTEAQIKDLIQKKVIGGGMLPKVEACLVALKGGVRKAHIIDGRIRHALLLEIFTDEGVGTQIVH